MTNPLSSFAHRTARWCALHPWRAILGWVAFVAFAVGLATMIPTQETTDADYRLGESGRADAMVATAGFDDPDTEQVLITARSGELDEAQAQQAAAAVVAGMTELQGVDEVAEPQVSPDGTAYLVSIQLARDQDDVAPLQEVTKAVQADFPQLDVRQSGDVSLDEAIDDRVADDLSSAETLSLPVTLILMLLAFGALIAAGIPVLLAGTSVAATVGILAPVSHLIHADSTVTSMIVLIGMAVGVDYSLFYLKREREERAKGHSTRDAVEIAAQTSGHSILVSGAAVICSMAGLFVMGDSTFNSLAVGSIIVVAVAVLGSITVLPALLAKLGRWVDRPRVPLLHRVLRHTPARRHQRPGARPGREAPARLAGPGHRGGGAAGRPGAGHEDAQRQPRDPAQLDPRGQDHAGPQRGVPVGGHHRGPGRAGRRLAAGRRGRRAGQDRGRRPRSRRCSARPAPRSRSRRTAPSRCSPWRCPFKESDDRVDTAIKEIRSELAPSALDGLSGRRGVRRRR